jgi:hypothetical protein
MKKTKLHDTLHADDNKLMLNLIPDIIVQLATGETMHLPELIDQKKYIFITIWSGKEGIDKHYLHTVDSIAEIYKNKLMVIELFDDGNLVRLNKLIMEYQLKNLQGVISPDIKKYLRVNAYPYGVLFSKNGKLIETGMNSSTLSAYLEKHVVASRSKF